MTAPRIVLQFENVGRERRSFLVTARSLTDPRILREVRCLGRLASTEVELVAAPDEENHGAVLVGGFRAVGTWRRVEDPPA